jgi:hypothetical protein
MTIGQAEPGGGELDNPRPLSRLHVDVESESDVLGMEGFGPIGVGNRGGHEFEFHVHHKVQLRHTDPATGDRVKAAEFAAGTGRLITSRFYRDVPTAHGPEHETPAEPPGPNATAKRKEHIPMLSKPSTSRTLAAISGTLGSR